MSDRERDIPLPQGLEELKTAYLARVVPPYLPERICAAAREQRYERSWRWVPILTGGGAAAALAVALIVVQVRMAALRQGYDMPSLNSYGSSIPSLSAVSSPDFSEVSDIATFISPPTSTDFQVPSLGDVSSPSTLGV